MCTCSLQVFWGADAAIQLSVWIYEKNVHFQNPTYEFCLP